MVPLPDSRHLPIFSSLTKGTIQNWQESPRLQMRSPTTKLTLKVLHDTYQCSDLPACLAALRTLCAQSPLTTLDIHGEFDEVKGTLPWLELFGVFSSLETLYVTGKGSILSMVCALGLTPVRTGADADTDAESDDKPVCPRLRMLDTTYVYWERGLAETIIGVLRLRSSYGLPQLEKLDMGLTCTDEGEVDEGDKTMERYAAEISSHVGRFDWGIDGSY